MPSPSRPPGVETTSVDFEKADEFASLAGTGAGVPLNKYFTGTRNLARAYLSLRSLSSGTPEDAGTSREEWHKDAIDAVENLAARISYDAGLGAGEWESCTRYAIERINEIEIAPTEPSVTPRVTDEEMAVLDGAIGFLHRHIGAGNACCKECGRIAQRRWQVLTKIREDYATRQGAQK